MFLEELRRSPWAVLPDYLPTISRVLARLERAELMSAADREAVEEWQERWAARRRESSAVSAPGNVGIIGVYGVLTQRGGFDDMSTPTTSSSRLASTIKQAAADPSISAVVLDVDSPGGNVYGIQELADVIYNARQSKPVIGCCNSLAASAAYWIASQCSELYAAPGAECGSIGVYALHVDYSEALKKDGIAVTYISAGAFKVENNPHQPLSDDARAFTQSTVDSYHSDFVRAVARGRGVSQTSVRSGMGQGRVLLPGPAQAAKMIDGVRTLGEVVGLAASRTRGTRALASPSSTPRLSVAMREVEIAELEM
jgi:signal peptide peptidase SppA